MLHFVNMRLQLAAARWLCRLYEWQIRRYRQRGDCDARTLDHMIQAAENFHRVERQILRTLRPKGQGGGDATVKPEDLDEDDELKPAP